MTRCGSSPQHRVDCREGIALLDRLAEQLLVLRCQLGDEQAFARIVADYDSRLRYYLVKLLGSRDAADDPGRSIFVNPIGRASVADLVCNP